MKAKKNNIIGERLKSARMQLGFSRREFADICGFSAATLQAWEDGKYPTPLKSIIKYVDSLFRCGLIATPEWFVKGEGLPPRPINSQTLNGRPKDEIMLREILFFEKENENAITTTMFDDSMHPFYTHGDVLGGIIVSLDQIEKYIGSICMVTIASGELLVRKIKKGTEGRRYNLLSTNFDTEVGSAFLLNCELVQLAQIVWHRRIER